MGVSNPIHQEYRTGAPIKMILKGKSHGEACFAMHAAQTSRKHIQAWSKGERAGLINLMYCAKMIGNNFTSKVLKTQRTFMLLNGDRNLLWSWHEVDVLWCLHLPVGRPFLAGGGTSTVWA